MKTAYEIAKEEIGTHEVIGGENPRILQYHDCCTLHAKEDEIAWCSAFMNFCQKAAGNPITGAANARSWLTWGKRLDEPVEGCVVVLKRGAPPSGHVGFFVCKISGGFIKVLGGNQSDSVKYSNFKESDVLEYRGL